MAHLSSPTGCVGQTRHLTNCLTRCQSRLQRLKRSSHSPTLGAGYRGSPACWPSTRSVRYPCWMRRIDSSASFQRQILLPKEERPRAPLPLVATARARHLSNKAAGDIAAALMTSPAATAPPDMLVGEAARRMERLRVERLVVVDESGGLIGIVSRRDLLKVFLRDDDDIREEIRREVFARLLWADPTRVDIETNDGIVVLSSVVEQRSSIAVAVHLTRGIDGVVDVVDHLTYVIDDRVVRSLI